MILLNNMEQIHYAYMNVYGPLDASIPWSEEGLGGAYNSSTVFGIY